MSDNRPNQNGSIFTPRFLIGLAAVALFLVFVFQYSAKGDIGRLWFNATAPVWAFFIIVFVKVGSPDGSRTDDRTSSSGRLPPDPI